MSEVNGQVKEKVKRDGSVRRAEIHAAIKFHKEKIKKLEQELGEMNPLTKLASQTRAQLKALVQGNSCDPALYAQAERLGIVQPEGYEFEELIDEIVIKMGLAQVEGKE